MPDQANVRSGGIETKQWRQPVSDIKRESLTKDMVKHVRIHFHKFSENDLQAFTVERQKSDYPKAKAELVIFDGAGKAVMKGREFGGGQMSIWAS